MAEGEEYCVVYSTEDAFTTWVQAILALLALLSLYFKRHFETPRRTFITWFLDTSKQGIGAVYAHISNMAIAALISNTSRGDYVLQDECAWYAVSFIVDTTIGLLFSLLLLGILNGEAKKRGWKTLEHSGAYDSYNGTDTDHSDRYRIWSHQVLAWLVILTLVRGWNLLFLWIFSPWLARIADFLFQPIQADIRFELLFVMIIFPGILNLFYFWIADHYLKADGSRSSASNNTIAATHASMDPNQLQSHSPYIAAIDEDDDHQDDRGYHHIVPIAFSASLSFELPNIPLERVRTLI